jgi:2-polyprenyl-3-methyl-5-hydroxy-6-metoxy-1,4-benzoquinol methylase
MADLDPLGEPILEVGCGTGWLTERLTDWGPTTAIDLSTRAVEMAKSRGTKAQFIAGDFYTAELQPGSFAVAICIETIAYVPNAELFLAKLASLLRPNGLLILTTVNPFVYRRRSDIGPPAPGQIRNWLSRGELHRLLRAKFRVISSRTFLPRGDRGVLRIAHSVKLNRLLSKLWSDESITRAKEWLGLGHCRIVVARRSGAWMRE